MMIERIPFFFILLSLVVLSGRHVSGFSLPSGACSFPSSIAVVDRHHNDHRHAVVVVNSSISSMKLMASTSGINGSNSSSSSSSNNDTAFESAASSATTKLPPPDETTISKAPSLNGKIVLPVKVMAAGLQGHRVAAVYAILNSNYKRGSGEGWEHVNHIGVTKDLARDIAYFSSLKGSQAVAHVRALSFSYPQKATMEDFASGWRRKVNEATRQGEEQMKGNKYNNDDHGDDDADVFGWGMVPLLKDQDLNGSQARNIITVLDDYEDDDDDDDDMDEDDLDDYLQMMAESRAAVSSSTYEAVSSPPPLFVDNTGLTNIVSLKNKTDEIQDVISPFETTNSVITTTKLTSSPLTNGEHSFFELGIENVDKVLDEVRPYLISDGGNVRVQSVDTETGNVYLLLEGACGSCASSTVTMKMGIERVLKEKFGDRLGEVIQVEPGGGEEGGGSKPQSELTIEAVQAEVNRMSAAITAMGGVVRVVTVDPIGVVEIEFRGPNRVKKGLELALLDVEFVKHVKFVS